MYLRRLELQGFKTFAQKTVLEFLPDTGGRRGLTSVVGPNGSGKSNVADAIRWVMGEQSMKLLRGKKSEDVIFSGSEKKARAGFAEVSMILENDDHPDIDLPEIVITRRLYRDGQSEYEVNKQAARLTDVALLLAQAGIGQRTYSVIGQGMVDNVLVATPLERKEFFDEAAGLRPFQLKRQASQNKLEATKDNLAQAELLLREIGPRLTSLERQAKRLQERDGLETELRDIERAYYGGMWAELRAKMQHATTLAKAANSDRDDRVKAAHILEEQLTTLEKATPPSEGFRELRTAIDHAREERGRLRERLLRLEASQEVALARAEKPWSPLPLSKIIEAIDTLHEKHEALFKVLSEESPNIAKAKKLAEEVRHANAELLSKLQRPAPEPEKARPATDPAMEKEMKQIHAEIVSIESKMTDAERRLEEWNKNEEGKRTHIFELQHQLTAVRNDAAVSERKANDAAIELARLETRREGFQQDLRTHAPALEKELDRLADSVGAGSPRPPTEQGAETAEQGAETAPLRSPDVLLPRLTKLRSQIEWIGGIDPAVLKEYEETKVRFETLTVQTEDLQKAMSSLDLIIAELDQTIKDRAETAFRLLDREFGLFFKKLFGGGEAKLLEIPPEPEMDEEGNIVRDVPPDAPPAGIEIQATPPGKRLKSIALLSGGERALTSIALICAIMATNPSPFVVLDEVDAALDESNSRKFAEIIGSLADRTQFVVITHNRATMQMAHVLYGVTMGDDGVSQLLSVKLEDLVKTS